MTVQSILSTKGSECVTTSGTASLRDAAKAMAEGRFGALVVSATGDTVDGIISERDIVRAVAEHGSSALDLPVSRAMTKDVITCQRGDRVDAVMGIMSEKHFRHMPVVEGERLVGMVSMTDIMRKKLDDVQHEATALRDFIAGH